ncbi:MAG: hypothetical protein WBE76_06620 [Terracidiphilus sp.]
MQSFLTKPIAVGARRSISAGQSHVAATLNSQMKPDESRRSSEPCPGISERFKGALSRVQAVSSLLALAALTLPACAGAQAPPALSSDPPSSGLFLYYSAVGSNLYRLEYPWARGRTNRITGPGAGPSVGSPFGIASYLNTIYGANEVFYLANDPQGGQQVEQLWGATALPMDLTANTVAPAPDSSLVGYINPCEPSDNVFYIGTDQHVHLLTWTPLGGWSPLDITAKYDTGGNALGGVLIGHLKGNLSEEVFYLEADHHVHELWRWSDCSTGTRFDGWHNTDVTIANGGTGPDAAAGSPLAGFFDAKANVDGIFYVGTDQHIHELLFPAQPVWTNIDVTKVSGAPAVPSVTSLAAHVNTIANREEVFYLDANSEIHQLWTSSLTPTLWRNVANTINAASGGAPRAESGSPLVTDVITLENADEVYYIGEDKHLIQFRWDGIWQHFVDVTALAGAPPAAP